MGLELDGSGFGLGTRSQRYAAVFDNGVVSRAAGPLAPCFLGCRFRMPVNHPLLLTPPVTCHHTRTASPLNKQPTQVKALQLENGGGLTCSSAESVLSIL
jgi:hypothetical protein